MKTSTIIWIIVVVVVIGGGWYLLSSKSNTAPAAPSTATQTRQNAQGPDYTPTSNETPTTVSSTTESAAVPTESSSTGGETSAAPMNVTVTLTASGFSPETVTIPKGGTVTWVNQGGGSMWVASGVHPTHTLYDSTSKNEHCAAGYTGPTPFDECGTGDSYSFTFDQAGTWKYHNHLLASETGTVVVQ